MKNVEMSVEGQTLTIKVNLNKSFGLSKSGKTEIIATTAGNQKIEGRNELISMSIYRKP